MCWTPSPTAQPTASSSRTRAAVTTKQLLASGQRSGKCAPSREVQRDPLERGIGVSPRPAVDALAPPGVGPGGTGGQVDVLGQELFAAVAAQEPDSAFLAYFGRQRTDGDAGLCRSPGFGADDLVPPLPGEGAGVVGGANCRGSHRQIWGKRRARRPLCLKNESRVVAYESRACLWRWGTTSTLPTTPPSTAS